MRTYDLICLSHLRWNFVYQRPQHLMSHAAQSHRVFFVEEPIFDSREPELEVAEVEENLWVVVPHLPADFDDGHDRTQENLLAGLLNEHGIRDYVLWYFTPMALGFTGRLAARATVYDCMDELSGFAGAPPELAERERRLLERSDLVFTGGRTLYEAKRSLRENVFLFPSSVDVPHFAQARDATLAEPEDQAALASPRLGFYGVVDERMDQELLAGVADLRPDWQLVVVGPVVKIDSDTLPQRPNIHYLGSKSYEELPAYLAGWDVALIPFARNEATRFISPTKTPEYLAAGKPVVSTSITDVVTPYAREGLARIADTPAETVAAAEAAMAENAAERLAKVAELLASTSWTRTWGRMAELVDEAIEYAETSPLPSRRGRASGRFDFLVVGAGFAGSVLAERLASQAGKRVLLVDRRPHIGGNAFDHYDDAGVLVHRYGPHIFHTNSRDVFDYLSRFTGWRRYEHRVRASVEGRLVPIPINLDTINELYGLGLNALELEGFFASVAEPVERIRTSEDVVVSKVGRDLYEKFFRGYTRKQWDLDPSELDASVTARVPTRTNRDDRYFTDTYQAMPRHGYTRMFERILDHPQIKLMLNTDFREVVDLIPFEEMVYTGAVDEFFDLRFGKLPYRSIEFRFETHDRPVHQPAPVVNYPNEHPYTRVTEFKYLTGQEHAKTTVVYEYPQAEGDPYYPVPRPENGELYRRYKTLADNTPGVHFVGRLATYKYYNMDQVVAQALTLFRRLTGGEQRPPREVPDELSARLTRAARAVGGAGVHGQPRRRRVPRSD